MKKNMSAKKQKNSELLIRIGFILILLLCIVIYFKFSNSTTNKSNGSKNTSTTKLTTKPTVEIEKKLNIVDTSKNTRNVAVMINNIKTVWGYQAGIQDAYILYEIITEGGISRLMGIYRDVNTGKIGSVRSSRIYYLDYVLENDAIYVHVGGSKEALSDIKTLNITDLASSVTYRDAEIRKVKAVEHTAFTDMKRINDKISSRNIRNTSDKRLLLKYSVDELDLSKMDGAIKADNVFIKYSNSKSTSFKYDSDNKVYKRYQNDAAHKDYVTKKQYTTKNIITYQVKNSSYDSYGRQQLDNVGSGDGYFISNGYAVPITWEKSSRSAQTIYRYKNGEEIVVNDGNTHIEIQPKSLKLEIN